MHHRNRCAPVALTGDQPIAHLVRRLRTTTLLLLEPRNDLVFFCCGYHLEKFAVVADPEIIKANTSGIRWADLVRAVRAALPDENPNTVNGSLHHFRNTLPADVSRPDRGVYAIGDVTAQESVPALPPAVSKFRESDFYQPFADFLVGDLEEATRAEPIGGNGAGGKWGTPDVIGLYEAKPSHPIKFTTEVVAAEIKIDTQSLIVAFGQA